MSKDTVKKQPYKRAQPTIKNPDRICVICKSKYKAVAPLQKTCSEECRKTKNRQAQEKFKLRHPEKQKEYNENRKNKNPDVWKDKYQEERQEIINTLGGKCIVCDHDNPKHLHVDYIPTMIGTGYRHPRHKRWVLDNIKDFRLLCANHHYELTTTGEIEGTNIKQKRHND